MKVLALAWLLSLAGCATQPIVAKLPAPLHPELAAFKINGRIAIHYRDERFSAGIHWEHQDAADEILLLNPLGQTLVRVTSDASHASLEQGEQHYQADNIETLMSQILGWYLPLKSLHYWVLGMPDSDSPAQIERDKNDLMSAMHQADWEIRYVGYEDKLMGGLPLRLQFDHDDLKAKLFIDEWDWSLSK